MGEWDDAQVITEKGQKFRAGARRRDILSGFGWSKGGVKVSRSRVFSLCAYQIKFAKVALVPIETCYRIHEFSNDER